MQPLDEQIKKEIQKILESSEEQGLSIDVSHKLIFEKLGPQYGPAVVERNLLAVTVQDQDFDPFNKYEVMASFGSFLKQRPKFILLIIGIALFMTLLSFGIVWLDTKN